MRVCGGAGAQASRRRCRDEGRGGEGGACRRGQTCRSRGADVVGAASGYGGARGWVCGHEDRRWLTATPSGLVMMSAHACSMNSVPGIGFMSACAEASTHAAKMAAMLNAMYVRVGTDRSEAIAAGPGPARPEEGNRVRGSCACGCPEWQVQGQPAGRFPELWQLGQSCRSQICGGTCVRTPAASSCRWSPPSHGMRELQRAAARQSRDGWQSGPAACGDRRGGRSCWAPAQDRD